MFFNLYRYQNVTDVRQNMTQYPETKSGAGQNFTVPIATTISREYRIWFVHFFARNFKTIFINLIRYKSAKASVANLNIERHVKAPSSDFNNEER